MTDTSIPKHASTLLYSIASRRSFLKSAAATAVAGGVLAACNESSAQKTALKAKDASGGTTAPNPVTPASIAASAAAMDAMHEAGIKAFPAKTEGKGNQILAPRVEKGVKVFDITATQLRWETAPGQTVEAWAYNGQVPGPQIRV